jgi:hypothetical protein
MPLHRLHSIFFPWLNHQPKGSRTSFSWWNEKNFGVVIYRCY